MFSLDVVRWRDNQQQQSQRHSPLELSRNRNGQSQRDGRDEEPTALHEALDGNATLPHVHQSAQAQRDRKLKKLYGRTQQEMRDAYVERVGQWMLTAPTESWASDYAKHMTNCRDYVPRERTKTSELGGPMVKTNVYSPRAVFKGGGECVRSLTTGDPSAPPEEREEYREAIRFIQKTREKDKEIHAPMSVPANKSLEGAHYFVEDNVCARPSSRQQLHPLRPDRHHGDPPPTTAEYVAHPQWRAHSPERWMSNAFVSTVASTNAHSAQNRSITGARYAPSVLTSETFVPPHRRHPLAPKDAALNPRDHDRRAQTAAAALREARSPRRQERKYFGSMWTQPGSPSRAAAVTLAALPHADGQDSACRNNGRVLALELRARASCGVSSLRKARSRTARNPVTAQPLATAVAEPAAEEG